MTPQHQLSLPVDYPEALSLIEKRERAKRAGQFKSARRHDEKLRAERVRELRVEMAARVVRRGKRRGRKA